MKPGHLDKVGDGLQQPPGPLGEVERRHPLRPDSSSERTASACVPRSGYRPLPYWLLPGVPPNKPASSCCW